MLKLEALTFHHSDSQGDQNYSFDLVGRAGEIVGLTGRSGSGKSTCLDLIAGFLTPVAGTVEVDGTNINARPPGQRPVTILFQNNNLFEHLGVRENVALGVNPSLKLTPAENDQVAGALSKVGLGDMLKRSAASLSGGEQQRVAVARAIAKRPQVLLCDEPTGALDSKTGTGVLEAIERVNREFGTTTAVITHNAAIADMADRVVVFGDGRVTDDRTNAVRTSVNDIHW